MGIRKEAQEMQKDLTLRKCLIDEGKLLALVQRCESFKAELSDHVALVDEVGPSLQEIWKEQMNRVKLQQEMYQVSWFISLIIYKRSYPYTYWVN